LLSYFMGCIVLVRCVLVLRCGLAVVVWYPYAGWSLHTDTNLMSLALLFHYLMINMFRMLIHPSSGACDPSVESPRGLHRSGLMCVGATLWHQHTSNQSGTTHEVTQQMGRRLLRMDVLTSETCWSLNNEIIKQVTSSWSLFIQIFY